MSDTRPLSILAVTSELPWPLNSGGHLRTFYLLRYLARNHRVRLVTAVAEGQHGGIEELTDQGIEVHAARVGPRIAWREGLRAAAAAVRREPYVLYRRHDRKVVRSTVREELLREVPDVLYLDHLDSALFRTLGAHIPAVLDLHNVYSLLAGRTAAESGSPLRRLYLQHEARLLARIERRAAAEADGLFAVSEEEARYFAGLGGKNVRVVPNGVDCAAYADLPTGRGGDPKILYVGTLSWGPNAAAAVFLARSVLPILRQRFPQATLRLVGKDPAPEILALGQLPGVEVAGAVPDVRPHLAAASLLAVPLEAGGGTRLKILEAFAAGLPVVSTTVGCEGIRAANGEHLVVAERRQFAEAILDLLAEPARGEALAIRARGLARDVYDWNVVGAVAAEGVRAVARVRSSVLAGV